MPFSILIFAKHPQQQKITVGFQSFLNLIPIINIIAHRYAYLLHYMIVTYLDN